MINWLVMIVTRRIARPSIISSKSVRSWPAIPAMLQPSGRHYRRAFGQAALVPFVKPCVFGVPSERSISGFSVLLAAAL
jgi:hypothetical protein